MSSQIIADAANNSLTGQTSGSFESLDVIIEDKTNLSQSISALNQTVSLISVGMCSAIVEVHGTFIADLVFEGTLDGSTYFPIYGVSNTTLGNVNSINSPDQVFFNIPGLQQFRIRCDSYTSGTPVVSLVVNQGFSGLVSPATGTVNGQGSFPVEVQNQITAGIVCNTDSASIGVEPVTEIGVNNDSTTNLAAGASFTGLPTGTGGIAMSNIQFIADQPCTLQIQQSPDGINWDLIDSYNTTAGVGYWFPFQFTGYSYKIKVTNNGSATTTYLRLKCLPKAFGQTLPRTLTATGNFQTAVLEPLPTGSNVIGHVIVDSIPTTNVTNSGTFAVQATNSNLELSQGSSTSGQKGPLIQGAVTSSLPSYSSGQTSPFSLNLNGCLRVDATGCGNLPVSVQNSTILVEQGLGSSSAWKVDGSAVTQPISGAVSTSDGSIVSLGSSSGKSIIMETGNLTTTSGTANQTVLTYTVTSGKTFYLQYMNIETLLSALSTTGKYLGTASLEIGASVKITHNFNNETNEVVDRCPPYIFSEPLPVSSGTVIKVVCTPSISNLILWQANFGGYEK